MARARQPAAHWTHGRLHSDREPAWVRQRRAGPHRAQEHRPVKTESLLRPVSRSFYLSIRILPRRLREPVGLAYLLARTTDSVADTAAIPAESRIQTLEKLRRFVAGERDPKEIVDLTAGFVQLQQNGAEGAPIAALPGTLAQ